MKLEDTAVDARACFWYPSRSLCQSLNGPYLSAPNIHRERRALNSLPIESTIESSSLPRRCSNGPVWMQGKVSLLPDFEACREKEREREKEKYCLILTTYHMH
ncbi:hypothetical protein FHG87_000778 [Trinorchestia longiramus]|nr:hypothetical protein FHG87_000778 [Trinorchestia longiramus]